MTGHQDIYEDFNREVVVKASFQVFQTSFSDVLQTKFDPSIRGLFVDGTASESYIIALAIRQLETVSYCDHWAHLKQKMRRVLFT